MALRGLKFYTVKEVAEIMQVRIETVLRWIYSKTIKASKLPGSRVWRIREEDIELFMEQGSNMTDDIDESELDDILNGEVEEVKIADNSKPVAKAVPEHKEINKNNKSCCTSNKAKGEEIVAKGEDVEYVSDHITVGTPIKYKPEDVVSTFTFD